MMCVFLSSASWQMKFKHKGFFSYMFDLVLPNTRMTIGKYELPLKFTPLTVNCLMKLPHTADFKGEKVLFWPFLVTDTSQSQSAS